MPAKKSPDNDPETQARIARLLARCEQMFRDEFAKGPRTLHDIEGDVELIGKVIKESITQEIVDEAGTGYAGSRMRCACGQQAKFAGNRSRRIITLHGRLSFTRSYYYCRPCAAGSCPIDQQLDIGSAGCSRTVQAHIARTSAYLPFGQAAAELAAARGLVLSPSTVQRYAKAVGERLGKAWDQYQVQQLSGNLPAPDMIPERLYISMDGVKVHLDGQWRDAKLGVVYRRNDEGKIIHACYYGSVEPSHAFGHRIRVLADLRASHCRDLQMLGDGAEWIWGETRKHFPGCIETLDFYHLTDHVDDIGQARFGKESEQAKQWLGDQKKRLLDDGPSPVIKDIAAWRTQGKTNKELQRTTLCYMQTHRDRIQYKTLRDAGYHIGSGMMESGCKCVVKSRLGGAGMRWGEPGAMAILHLSTHRHSTGTHDFMPFTVS